MIFQKKKYVSSGSLGKLAWIQFRSNKLGVLSLTVICMTILIAISGYLITPDPTPYSNRQLLEISNQKPGFNVNVLKVRKNEPYEDAGWLNKMLFGSKSNFTEIPLQSYYFDGSYIVLTLYDPDTTGIKESYHLADVVFPVKEYLLSSDSSIEFIDIDNKEHHVDKTELKSQIQRSNIKLKRFLLGTDQFGRDLLSRLIIGTRVSISVGFISVGISLIVGILLGSLAGFFGGRTDDFIMWFINVIWSIPTLLLVIAMTFALGRGFWQIFVAVGLTMWVEVARVVRGQIMSIKEKEFIEAGFALGFSNFRIITKHIIPNILSPVIVISAANFAAAILIEAGLSFLGIGIQPPMPSWGSMIKEYYRFIILDSAYLAIAPGIAIVILVLAFMSLGNVLRDALDVKVMD
jgi:peptide/nickel transport system permease protein